jgi:hypothetical protein
VAYLQHGCVSDVRSMQYAELMIACRHGHSNVLSTVCVLASRVLHVLVSSSMPASDDTKLTRLLE